MKNNEIKQMAMEFAQKHKSDIVKKYAHGRLSFFMAGSPGAGKTEVAKRIAHGFMDNCIDILRIDPDELRDELPGYNGDNAHLFQEAVTWLAEQIQEDMLQNNRNFILDGTFSKQARLERYIDMSLARDREIGVFYVYQDPLISWRFVLRRMRKEGREVPISRFIKTYYDSRTVADTLKQKYKTRLRLDLVIKGDDGTTTYTPNITAIDNHAPQEYNKEDLEKKLFLITQQEQSNETQR